MNQLADTLKALGDETRLRILRLLLEESLNVGELTQVLGLAQSTVSKHLAELRRSGLVEGSRNGAFSYYRVEQGLGEWWQAIASSLLRREDEKGDLARLATLLQQREELSESRDRFVVPGRSWVAWTRALRFLLPRLTVADMGCGDGAFTLEMAGWAKRVYAIDSNPAFLKLARSKARESANIEFLEEDMRKVSLPDSSIDLAVISQSLHYVPQPKKALCEAHRILKPAGRILLLDLLPHEEAWVRDELKHRWMGFPPDTLSGWLAEAGFDDIQIDSGIRQSPDPFRIVIASGIKKGAEAN